MTQFQNPIVRASTSAGTVELLRVFGHLKIEDFGFVWNYNAPDNTNRGMKEVEILVSSDTDMDSVNFTAIALVLLTEGGEIGQAFDVVGTVNNATGSAKFYRVVLNAP